ncbi:MAG: VWA domain-containing protein [Phycisphaerales bacterium]|nr:VWA domain-containing protein [Phycisphaerales bacterium]
MRVSPKHSSNSLDPTHPLYLLSQLAPGVASALTAHRPNQTAPASGGRLVSADGRELPFLGCSLDVDAGAGIARVVLTQTFRNPGDTPLQVTYQMPLPADAAVAGYAFELGDRRIVGEIERRAAARERFEKAMLEGRSAGLLEQERSSVFTQQIGNIPPHTDIVCELVLDQPLQWLAEGAWEWRFPTVIAPRYMGEEGRVPDIDRIAVDVLEHGAPARAHLNLRVRDVLLGGEPSSSTHTLSMARTTDTDAAIVTLAAKEGAALDRDLAVRWPVAQPDVGVSLEVARPATTSALGAAAFGLLTVTPPSSLDARNAIPRDLTVLIDTSGSMSGRPLGMAKAIVTGLIESLKEHDTLDLVEFSSRPRRWCEEPRNADAASKQAATAWVKALRAEGGTEMSAGMREAMKHTAPDRQRQIVLVTDGLVGFESEVVAAARVAAKAGARVHAIGVGSATNRTLTSGVARAGGGAEHLVADGDVALATQRIVARTAAPLVVGIQVEGTALIETPAPVLPDLLGGAPSLIPLRLNVDGGELVVRGRTADGLWTQRVVVPASAPATGRDSIARLFGRERVEELEVEATGQLPAEFETTTKAIEGLGLSYSISTRCTSWIAVSLETTVDPKDPTRRVVVPQELPDGMSAEGLGLRRCGMLKMDPVGLLPTIRCGIRSRVAFPVSVRSVRKSRQGQPGSTSGPSSSPVPQKSRIVHGTIVSRTKGTIVIEIELAEPLNWAPRSVQVDGAAQPRIRRSATTRSGSYGAGLRIRLVIERIPVRVGTEALASITVEQRETCPRLVILLQSA